MRLASAIFIFGLAAVATAAESLPSTFVRGLPDQYFVTLLIVGGLLLMLAEIKVTSYGLLSLGGIACVIAACAILTRTGQTLFGIPPHMIIPVLVALTILEIILVVISVRSGKSEPSTGMDSFSGQVAEVSRALSPEGKVFFNGSYWDAVSTAPVEAGKKVRIVSTDSMRLTVTPIE
ncbi:MAG: NfeD family protein [Candidatus Sumerlaeaceae bacterium]